MSPLPSFGPDWFTAKLPGTLPPRPLPPCAFGLPPAPPGLIAQMPELATVSPGVAALVAHAHQAPPLTTPGMPPPPPSVLAMPVRCGRPSMVPRCGGDLWDIQGQYPSWISHSFGDQTKSGAHRAWNYTLSTKPQEYFSTNRHMDVSRDKHMKFEV